MRWVLGGFFPPELNNILWGKHPGDFQAPVIALPLCLLFNPDEIVP